MAIEIKNVKKIGSPSIPFGWEATELGKISKITSGGTPSRKIKSYWGGNIPWVTTSLIDFNQISSADEFISEDGLKNSSTKLFPAGTLIMALYGQGVTRGKTAILQIEAATNQACAAIILNQNKADIHYIFQYLIHKYEDIRNLSNTGNQNNLNGNIVKSIKLFLPPIPEQKSIANALGVMDDAINANNQLIAQKELCKKWLMHNLLSGKRRLKGFTAKWSPIKFQEIYSPIKEKAGDRKLLVLSVTKDGIMSQAEYFKKEIASKDTSPYLVMKKGDMVMSGLNFWMGSIDVLSQYEEGMVSPAYKVFEIINDDISSEFMKSFVRSKLMLRALVGSSVIGASIVRRNMDRETLNEWTFKLPSLEEQKAISQVLQAADKEIFLLRAKTDRLEEQKKGMMQVLLTGKKRLKID